MNIPRQITDTFASLLARWMERNGFDGETMEGRIAAAKRLSVSHETIRNWLHGGLPPQTRVPILAEALGVGAARLRRLIDQDRTRRASLQPVEKA